MVLVNFHWLLLFALTDIISFQSCSLEKCLIFWYMHHSVVRHNANTPIVVKSRVCSGMGYNVEHVRQEDVCFVRKCGISFNFMPELVKNLSAMFHVAGLLANLLSLSWTPNLSLQFDSGNYLLTSMVDLMLWQILRARIIFYIYPHYIQNLNLDGLSCNTNS